MYLNELRIDDFGCFRNARLQNLDDNLVVIGGPQRAGKTTFMQVLRQFPAGVNRGTDLPPPTNEYRVDAEITHDGRRYRYVLNGHASPSVSPIDDGPEIDAEDIFGPVTARQYRNLYTISLDELRRLPPGIDDSEDLARVLLGGAYGDIAEIPEIEESFGNRAYEIGLSRGDPDTKTSLLYDPYRTIREGMEARREASQQVDEHRSVTETLEDKRSELAAIKDEIERERQHRNRLNVLEELFDPLQRLDTLNAQLDDVDPDAIEEFPAHLTDRLDHFVDEYEGATAELSEARQEYDRKATIEANDEYYEWLLEHERAIEDSIEDRKVLAKTAEELSDRRADLETKKGEIEREISSLYSEWDGSFAHIDDIETSTVDTERVEALASDIEGWRAKRDDLELSIDEAETRKKNLEAELAEMDEQQAETQEIAVPKRKPAVVAGVALAVGTAVGFAVTPLVGGAVGLVVLAVGLYAVDSTVTVDTTVDAEPYRQIKGQIATLEGEIRADSEQLAALDGKIDTLETELGELVGELGLPEELPTGNIPEFYNRIVALDKKIAAYRENRKDWEEEKAQSATDLEEVATLLEGVADMSWTADEPLEDADEVLGTLEVVRSDLELARDVRRAEQKRTECIENIDSVLTQWDEDRSIDPSTEDQDILQHIQKFDDEAERVTAVREQLEERRQLETQITNRLENESAQEAFEPLRDDDEPWLNVVRNAVPEYTDTDAIANDIRERKRQIETLEDRREELQEDRIELEQRQERLATEDDLRDARAKIEEGRVEFERLGEAYAVNRIAESILTQLHDRLMEDVVHSLVDDASEIFSEITREYEGIELAGEVQDLEFHALRGDKPDHGVGELSRATGEQLFLAVRLARIRQTNVSLPVVLDDAATNFDPNHMNRVFEIIDQLTESNQVFFLTCHPQCVRMTGTNGRSAQYWSIDGGQFSLRDTADTLERHLTAD